jgi:molybdopterin synthase sulfur carrier subunit
MKLRVHYTAQLRAAVGRSEEEVELPEGSSLADLLIRLAGNYREAQPHLATASGGIRPSLLVVVNNAAVPLREAPARVLFAGDVVMLLPPIAGG